jgi:hypothetical protein
MGTVKTDRPTESVRRYVRKAYVEPARRRGESTVRVVAGEVQKAVGLTNRAPLVCQALGSRKFLDENHLVLERRDGPPSGIGTTVTFTYRLQGEGTDKAPASGKSALLDLWGAGREVFESLGGGESFLRRERERFYGPGKRR